MLANIISEPQTFREASEDLVKTIHEAVYQHDLSAQDRAWLIGELDELIEELKNAKVKIEAQKPEATKKVNPNGLRQVTVR